MGNQVVKSGIARRVEEVHCAVAEAPLSRALDIATEHIEKALREQSEDSARHGANVAACSVSRAAITALLPVLTDLHSLVPELAKTHKVPTSVMVKPNSESHDALEGERFGAVVDEGISSAYTLEVTGADGTTMDSTDKIDAVLVSVVGTVVGLATDLVNKIKEARVNLSEIDRIAEANEASRREDYDKRIGEAETEFNSRKTELETEFATRAGALLVRFTSLLYLLDRSTVVDMGEPDAFVKVMQQLRAVKVAARDLRTELTSGAKSTTVQIITAVNLAQFEIPKALTAEIDELTSRRDGLISDLTLLSTQKEELGSEIGLLINKRANAESRKQLADEALEDIQRNLQNVKKERDGVVGDLDEARTKRQTIVAEGQRVNGLVERARADVKTKEDEVKRLDAVLLDRTRRRTELDVVLGQKEAGLGEIESRLAPLRKEEARLKGVVSDLRAEESELNTRLPTLRSEKGSLEAAVETARAAGVVAEETLRKLDADIAGREGAVKAREGAASVKEATLLKRAGTLDSREADLTTRKDQLDTRSAGLGARSTVLDAREAKVTREEELTAQVAARQSEVEELKRQLEAMKLQLEAAQSAARAPVVKAPEPVKVPEQAVEKGIVVKLGGRVDLRSDITLVVGKEIDPLTNSVVVQIQYVKLVKNQAGKNELQKEYASGMHKVMDNGTVEVSVPGGRKVTLKVVSPRFETYPVRFETKVEGPEVIKLAPMSAVDMTPVADLVTILNDIFGNGTLIVPKLDSGGLKQAVRYRTPVDTSTLENATTELTARLDGLWNVAIEKSSDKTAVRAEAQTAMTTLNAQATEPIKFSGSVKTQLKALANKFYDLDVFDEPQRDAFNAL